MSTLRKILLGVDRDILEEDGYDLSARSEQIVLLAQLHCLPSTVDLFARLLRPDVGILPSRVVVVPKPYSSIPSALRDMKEAGFQIIDQTPVIRPGHYDNAVHRGILEGCSAAFRICQTLVKSGRRARLVIVDDGGLLTETWWRLSDPKNAHAPPAQRLDAEVLSKLDVISVQQTASGIRRKPDPAKLTKIDISRSAAKRLFESKVIAKGVLKKVRALHLLNNIRSVGIVGLGALGTALAKDLRLRGDVRVFAYEKGKINYPDGVIPCASLKFMLREAEVIFGCTGANSLRVDQLSHVRSRKPIHFISCSSRDVEFKDLLQLGHQSESPFDCITVKLPSGQTHYVENGGFPINFDREEEQEGPDEIALTRALVFTGVLQAIYLKKVRSYKDALMLSPRAQQYIVEAWMSLTGSEPEQFGVASADVLNLKWWQENSGGCFAAGNKVAEANHGHPRAFAPRQLPQFESTPASPMSLLRRQSH